MTTLGATPSTTEFPTGGAMTGAEILAELVTVDGAGSGLDADTLDGTSSAGFATSAQGATADAAVAKATYDANSILIATADNTPIALTIAASRHIGRKSSGDIDDLTAAESRTILDVIPLVTQVASGTILMPQFALAASFGPGAGNLVCCSIMVYGVHTVSALVCNVTTAGTGSTVARLGLFANDPATGKPGTLLVDAGTVAATSTGVKTITGLSTAITPGLYWGAAVFQTVTGSPVFAAGQGSFIMPAANDSTFGVNPASSYYQFSVTGAFSASYAFAGGTDARAPLVGLTV